MVGNPRLQTQMSWPQVEEDGDRRFSENTRRSVFYLIEFLQGKVYWNKKSHILADGKSHDFPIDFADGQARFYWKTWSPTPLRPPKKYISSSLRGSYSYPPLPHWSIFHPNSWRPGRGSRTILCVVGWLKMTVLFGTFFFKHGIFCTMVYRCIWNMILHMVYRCYIWLCLKLGIHPPPKSPNFDRENADRPVGFRDIDAGTSGSSAGTFELSK